MSNAGQEDNTAGAVEVAIDHEVDVIDGRTANSQYSERDIVYHRRNIDRSRTSAGKLRGQAPRRMNQSETDAEMKFETHGVLFPKPTRILGYVALASTQSSHPMHRQDR
jgi:hypothetical protein